MLVDFFLFTIFLSIIIFSFLSSSSAHLSPTKYLIFLTQTPEWGPLLISLHAFSRILISPPAKPTVKRPSSIYIYIYISAQVGELLKNK